MIREKNVAFFPTVSKPIFSFRSVKNLVTKCSLSCSVLLKNLLTKKQLESEKPSRVRLDYCHSLGCGSRASFPKSTSSFPKQQLIIKPIQLEGLLKFRV